MKNISSSITTNDIIIVFHFVSFAIGSHNRYLLNNCFDKILHLEDTDIQEFEGSFVEYNF